tara:strand:- start:191 stop:490 length:300 start_codon:yes stop_codon:yes gene_type:complete
LVATSSHISLRPIQRIENDGSFSLESKKALAALYNIKLGDLEIQVDAIKNLAASKRGRMYGFAGATAGLYFGAVGAFCGVYFGIIAALSNKRKSNIGQA